MGSTFWFTTKLEKRPEGEVDGPGHPHGPARPARAHRGRPRDQPPHPAQADHLLGHEGRHGRRTERRRSPCSAPRPRSGEPYDLAVLDMQMPDMDGIQLARAIGDEPAISSTRLVLLTSIGLNINEEASRAGVEVVLTKPVRQSQLHDALATMMGTSTETPARPSRGERAVPAPPAENRAGRVLLAEDYFVNRMVAIAMLERSGYRVDAVATARRPWRPYRTSLTRRCSWTCRCPRWTATRQRRRSAAAKARDPAPPSSR